LLRCANKHSVSESKTKDKTLKAMCLLHCAHKHSLSEFKSSKPNQRQNPLRAEKASVVLSIRCGYSHHECHTCFAAHISTKLLILLFY
jgi:hypothetical protein